MASVSKEGRNYRVQFTGPDGKRHTLRIGRVLKRVADSFRDHIEDLVGLAKTGQRLNAEQERWLATLCDDHSERLVKAGIAPKRQVSQLGEHLDEYIESRKQIKPRTRHLLKETAGALLEFFDRETPLRDITKRDAERFREFLLGKPLGENTVRRRCGRARQFLRAAQNDRRIVDNPFSEIPCCVKADETKFYFVTHEDAQRVLEACPDHEWHLLFALARYGGLRCPSETLTLRWQDVDWQNERMRVRSPKTEHHEGKAFRFVPIFPNLRPHLELAFDRAEDGAEYCINRYRSQDVNLRTQLHKIIERAGLTPWPKAWQNLRSTRETELVELHGIKSAVEWIGNSEAVARKHYLQTTESDFLRAIRTDVGSDAKSDAMTVSQSLEAARTEPKPKTKPSEKPLILQGESKQCDSVPVTQVPRAGLEPALAAF